MRNRDLRHIIGLDLDSVIAKTEYALDKYIKDNYGIYLDWDKEVLDYKVENFPKLTAKMKEDLLVDIRAGNLFSDIHPYDNVVDSINMVRDMGVNVYIVTSRSSDLLPLTMRWLKNHGVGYEALSFTSSDKKWQIAKSLNMKAFVEDRLDILESIYETCGPLKYGSYLIDHSWNRYMDHEYIDRVPDLNTALKRIIELGGFDNVESEM